MFVMSIVNPLGLNPLREEYSFLFQRFILTLTLTRNYMDCTVGPLQKDLYGHDVPTDFHFTKIPVQSLDICTTRCEVGLDDYGKNHNHDYFD